MTVFRHRSVSIFARTLCAGVMLAASFGAWAVIAPNDPPDLSSAPPDTSLGVNPNIFVSFDDSGSMQQTVMGDFPPQKTATSDWAGPWRCANVIDPDHSATATDKQMRAIAMNGVFYNLRTNYAPPLKEDGSAFPLAIDATLQSVYLDGIAVGRPFNAVTPVAVTSTAFSNNTDVNGGANDTGRANLVGRLFVQTGTTATCTGQPGTCSCTGTAGTSSRVCTTDNRWQCGTGTATQNTNSRYTAASPMDGLSHTLSDGTTVLYGPAPAALVGGGGGPYYFRYKLVCGTAGAQATPNCSTAVPLDAYGKPSSAAALTALYTASNWEAVPIDSGTYANFANWYAYYRTRNQMARTAMSRVFGVLGTPQKSNIRIAWQNLGNNDNLNWTSANTATSGGTAAPTNNIVELDDNTAYTGPNAAVGNNTWRQAFFNWLFNVEANNGTPSRNALLRVGNYFKRGQGVTNISNPYWQPQGTDGRELACRQNFHLLMTDGLYNQPVATAPSGTGFNTNSATALPTNTSGVAAYAPAATVSKLFADGSWSTDSDNGSSYSDISFYYWATNLRPDFTTAGVSVKVGGTTTLVPNTDVVPPYFPDLTLGITGSATPVPALNTAQPGATPEVFWNPANDPASWPHLVQFAVTLGAFGNLVNSTNTDCQNGATVTNDDGCALRKGVANSSGATGWPRPNGTGSGIAANIDDLWHAALDARGQFFVATSPQSLITRLTRILTNIVNRSGTQVSESVNSSILNQGSVAYQGGYNSNGWLGYLWKQKLKPDDPGRGSPVGLPVWDAACLLTSGACTANGTTTTLGTTVNSTPSASRIIFTSVGTGSSVNTTSGPLTGTGFQWTNLGTNEQLALNLDPTTTWPDATTTLVINSGVANGTQDANGQDRLRYIRGIRTNETTPTTSATNPTTFRPRLSVLGAIIDSQAVYEGGPAAGWQDIYPSGTPEQVAATATVPVTYDAYVGAYLNRDPMVYVGANDGMLHAFTAGTTVGSSTAPVASDGGKEAWAYVPHALYANGGLSQITNPANNGLVASVDDSPFTQDVFIKRPASASAAQWRTMLIGSLRLGGRGIFALDVSCTPQTAPTPPSCMPGSDTTAAGQFMWEFTSEQDSDLGYAYATANIARIRCNVAPCHGAATVAAPTGGTWVVLVTSGDFPICLPAANGSPTCIANGHAATDTAAGATTKATGPTYLWVLNADDGSLISKIPVSKVGSTTYGLSTPGVVDFGLDQIDDVAVAGDLAGNLWRFDLSSPDPTVWASQVDLMFQSYTTNTACSTTNAAGFGCEPITVMPVAFPDPSTGSVIYVFGSGQYLGASDNSVSSTYTTQHFFGVRDQGTASANYPIHESNLDSRTMTQTAGARTLPFTATTTASPSYGWQIPLNLAGNLGERDVATASPLYSAGVAVLTSLIPGQNLDPCQPGRSGAVIAIDATSGGPPLQFLTTSYSGTGAVVGGVVNNPPTVGGLSLISSLGGGSIVLPGITDSSGNPLILNGLTPVWRRTSWNELLNQL
jgi:type IV pilus assembly protein PilY1